MDEAVKTLRSLANIVGDNTYGDDTALKELIAEHNGSVQGAAAAIWRRKAASYAELTDVTEGASSRKLSTLYKQALEMANALDSQNDGTIPGANSGTKVRRIVRV